MIDSGSEKQSYHHGNLRQALIEGALECIRESGREHLSLRGIARQLGVSQSAPYRHFNDKNSLLTAIASQGFEMLTEQLLTATQHLQEDPVEALKSAGLAYIEFAIENPETYRLMFGMRSEDLCLSELDTESSNSFDVLRDVIARGQQRGVFKAVSLDTLALTSWSLVHGYASLVIDGVIDRHQPETNSLDLTPGQILIDGLRA